jgi:hypothetical protein
MQTPADFQHTSARNDVFPREDAPPVATPDESRRVPRTEVKREAILDTMIADTFPASDPLQLDSISDAGISEGPPRSDPTETSVSSAGTSQAAVVAGVLEETIALGDQGAITLRLIGQPVRLQILLGPNGLTLAADDLDMLVSSLQSKREAMEQPSASDGASNDQAM